MSRYTELTKNKIKYMNTPKGNFEDFLYEKGILEEAIRILKKYKPYRYDSGYNQALEYLEDFELNFILGA